MVIMTALFVVFCGVSAIFAAVYVLRQERHTQEEAASEILDLTQAIPLPAAVRRMDVPRKRTAIRTRNSA